MNFLSKWLGGAKKLDGMALVQSESLRDRAQMELLSAFITPRALHEALLQQQYGRAIGLPYADAIAHFQKLGWLALAAPGQYVVTPAAQPFAQAYLDRVAAARAEAMPRVRAALEGKQTSEALTIRRMYEATFPLGKAPWTGPDPQSSHSALTRRIFFLDHWLIEGLSKPTLEWLKLYAAEQHLWGAYWELPEAEIPAEVRQELTRPGLTPAQAVYWRAYQLALHVDNQETWQRCKGGDHVRRIEIAGPNDGYTCDACRETLGKEFLVARVPELPHRGCTSPTGCRCRYEPVLEALDELNA